MTFFIEFLLYLIYNRSALIGFYSEVESLLYTNVTTTKEALLLMNDGTCDAAVLPYDWFTYVTSIDSLHCDKTITEHVLSLPVAMPVSDTFAMTMSYAVGSYVIDGSYEQNKEDAIDENLGNSKCESISSDEILRLGVNELFVRSFSFHVMYCFTMYFVSLVVVS